MSYNATVLYPNKPDSTFDMEYYLSVHMPLVERIWGPAGLQSWHIVQYNVQDKSSPPPFIVAAILTWKDEASYVAGSASEQTSEIFDDVPKFSNHGPVFMRGSIVKSNQVA